MGSEGRGGGGGLDRKPKVNQHGEEASTYSCGLQQPLLAMVSHMPNMKAAGGEARQENVCAMEINHRFMVSRDRDTRLELCESGLVR